ncbi:MAG: uroporphyrinogen decarboxylase family protein [Kiritimatiellia bacterium]
MKRTRQIDLTSAVYEHAAALIGKTPGQVFRDAELLFQAHAEAFRVYGHAPVVVGIDIYNLEAEAYGATIDSPTGNGIPAISTPLCPGIESLAQLKPFDPQHDGRLPMVIETGRRLAAAFPQADVRIPVSGPFSLAGNLVGLDQLLCDLMDEPERFRETLFHLVRGQIAFCREIIAQGLGIVFFESGATPPLISPAMFAAIELPALQFIIREISCLTGRPVPCIIGGNTAPILNSILETGTGYVICPCETDQEAFMRQMRARPDVMVRINAATGVFASGDWAAVCRELHRVLTLAGDRDNVCIGTGVLPFETNPDIVLKAKAFLREMTK